MTCQRQLMNEGKPYPRTCQDCGLGPCKLGLTGTKPRTDMDDIIERAKGLGRKMGMLDIKVIVLDRYSKHIASQSSDADEDKVILDLIDAEINKGME